MARRRAKAKRVSPRGAVRRWPTFLAGCAAGAAVTFVIGSVELPRIPGSAAGPDASGPSEEGAEAAPAAKLRYDFYTILPEMEIAMPLGDEPETPAPLPETSSPPAPAAQAEPADTEPDTPALAALEAAVEPAEPDELPSAPVVEASAPAAPAPEPVAAAVESGGTYVLQVGSFRNAGDAERRRATLALLGLEARVQTVTIDGEATWHRVQVGPYDQLGALNDARVRLRENDIEAMALKVRKP